jgi:ribonuclease HI
VIFCDGACSGNPGPGGWGAIVRHADGKVRELGGGEPGTTNNRMELLATIEALAAIAREPDQTRLCTDSSYVINGITKWVHNWKRKGWLGSTGAPVANRDLWERLDEAVRSRTGRIEWRYVAGHTGVPGNERADAIAVAFAQGQRPALFHGPESDYGVRLDVMEGNGAPKPRSSKSGPGYSYLSLVEGVPRRHKTWAECEKRVKGVKAAKFRKAASAEDEKTILRAWGVDPGSVR